MSWVLCLFFFKGRKKLLLGWDILSLISLTVRQFCILFFKQKYTNDFIVDNFLKGEVTCNSTIKSYSPLYLYKVSNKAESVVDLLFEFFLVLSKQVILNFFPIPSIYFESEDKIISSKIFDFTACNIVISTKDLPLIFLRFLFTNLAEPFLAGIKHKIFFLKSITNFFKVKENFIVYVYFHQIHSRIHLLSQI